MFVAVIVAAAAADSSSLFEPLFPPEMLSIADVAAVKGCSKYLRRKRKKTNTRCGDDEWVIDLSAISLLFDWCDDSPREKGHE